MGFLRAGAIPVTYAATLAVTPDNAEPAADLASGRARTPKRSALSLTFLLVHCTFTLGVGKSPY